MYAHLLVVLLFAGVGAFPSGREDVVYPSMETLRSGIKIIRFRVLDQDIELRLEPAGDVIADNFTVIYGKNGEIDRSIDIQSLKRKLYKDAKMGASLDINEDGPLTINGVINSKLLIEPDKSKKPDKNGRIAHRVMEVIRDENFLRGTKIVSSASTRTLTRAEPLSDDEYIKLEYLFVAESSFSKIFTNDFESMESYLGKTMIQMEKMFDSLGLRIKVAMNGIIKLTDENQEKLAPYIPSTPSDMDGVKLLKNMNKFYDESTDELVINADIVMMITNRRLGSFDEEGKFTETMGGLSYQGGVCNNIQKCGVSKHFGQLDLAYTMAHESGHLLGCDDDVGEGDEITGTKDCPSSDGYIMSGTRNHIHFWEFSPCCKRSVDNKLKSGTAKCIIEKYGKKSNRK